MIKTNKNKVAIKTQSVDKNIQLKKNQTPKNTHKKLNKKIIISMLTVSILFFGVLIVINQINKKVQNNSNKAILNKKETSINKEILDQKETSVDKEVSGQTATKLNNNKIDISLIKTPNPEITKVLKEYSQILEKRLKELNINYSSGFSNSSSMTWNETDNLDIWIKEAFSVETIHLSDESFAKDKSKIINPIEKTLLEGGYKNASNSKVDNLLPKTDTYNYKKDNIKCSLIINYNEYTCDNFYPYCSEISFVCSDQYEKNYQYQSKIIKSLGNNLSKNALSRPLGEITLFDRYGIFVFSGPGQSFRVVGMMDANGEWHILDQRFTGDGIPCEILDEHPLIGKNYSADYCYYKDGSYSERNIKN